MGKEFMLLKDMTTSNYIPVLYISKSPLFNTNSKLIAEIFHSLSDQLPELPVHSLDFN